MICTTGITNELVNTILNPFLASYSYLFTTGGVLPAPFDQAALDWHVDVDPVVADGTLQTGVVGEVEGADGSRSGLAAPTLPAIDVASVDRMAVVQVSPFPVDTALATFFAQGALAYPIQRGDIPEHWYVPDVLSTNSDLYRLLMPKLHSAYLFGVGRSFAFFLPRVDQRPSDVQQVSRSKHDPRRRRRLFADARDEGGEPHDGTRPTASVVSSRETERMQHH